MKWIVTCTAAAVALLTGCGDSREVRPAAAEACEKR